LIYIEIEKFIAGVITKHVQNSYHFKAAIQFKIELATYRQGRFNSF